MADWQTLTRRAAQQEGVDPNLYVALVNQESSGRADAKSPTGAIGYSQLEPGTAKSLGVNPNDPWQNLLGGAKYLKQQLDRFGGSVPKALAAYNAGPGAVQKYGGIPPYAETQAYVKNILGAVGNSGGSAPAGDAPTTAPTSLPTTSGSSSTGDANAAALLALLGQQSAAPRPTSSTLQAPAATAGPSLPAAYKALTSSVGPAPKTSDLSSALTQNAATPGQAAADVAAKASPLVADASSGGTSGPSDATGGAAAALGWATSKIGFKETGTNSGGLASYLNSRFGLSNAPWCAMFTSAAVTKGGAPASARTASVADIRAQAKTGDAGYEKGFVDAANAKPGDLILFGDQHVGMVRSVSNGQINYVGGNQSNGVTTASTPVGSGDIVRPKYGARKR